MGMLLESWAIGLKQVLTRSCHLPLSLLPSTHTYRENDEGKEKIATPRSVFRGTDELSEDTERSQREKTGSLHS